MTNKNTVKRAKTGGDVKWKNFCANGKNGNIIVDTATITENISKIKLGFFAFQNGLLDLIINTSKSSVKMLSINHKVCITFG